MQTVPSPGDTWVPGFQLLSKLLHTAVALVLSPFGLWIVAVAVFFDGVQPRTPGRVTACILIGVLFAAIGVGFAVRLPVIWSRRGIFIGLEGLHWVDPRKARAFSLAWSDISTISMSWAIKTSRLGRPTLVHLDIELTDRRQVDSRPELQWMWNRAGAKGHLRLPMVPANKSVAPLNDALSQNAGGKYAGVRNDAPMGTSRYT